jgi:hypothetical protein
MPLLDHFHAPLAPRRHWESFHVNWAGAMADALNDHLLPEGYFAEEHAHPGARIEIDVATYRDGEADSARPGNGCVAPVQAQVWAPPTPRLVLPLTFPDSFQVLVFESQGGARLVSAIELVSPANKDRDSKRRAFAIKCGSYLSQGVSLIIIDIVTTRQANLHNQLMQLLGDGPESFLAPETTLYAGAYRPIVRNGTEQMEAWPMPLTIGQPLPILPLALNAELCLPLDLETTYTTACQRRRLG